MIAMLPQVVLILVALLGPQQSPRVGDATPLSKEATAQLATVAVTAELDCLGFISDTLMPLDIYVAGTEQEGLVTALMEGSLVYLNGSGLKSKSKRRRPPGRPCRRENPRQDERPHRLLL